MFKKGHKQCGFGKGYKHSAASLLKMRNSKLGKRATLATRQKMSKQRVGNKYRVGKPPWNKGKPFPRMKGAQNPNWRGGVSTEYHLARTNSKYSDWVRAVMNRDNFTCKKCLQRNGDHVAHHIENFSTNIQKRYDPLNGLTLCVPCHQRFHLTFGFKHNTALQLTFFLNGN